MSTLYKNFISRYTDTFTLLRLQLITMALFKILTLATIAAATGAYASTKVVVSDRSLQDAVSCIA